MDSLLEGDGFALSVPGRETVKPIVGDGTTSSKTEADLLRNRKFESISLQQRVGCEPHSSIVIGADELEACCERPPPLRVA
jgi:hypothetical protein